MLVVSSSASINSNPWRRGAPCIRVYAMPMGTRHRLTGKLLQAARGIVLQMDDGGAYVLDLNKPVRELLGHRVTVEGTRSGFDRLDIDWIGPAKP